jgi:predicted DNA-binding transcriptional regulator YafY
LVGYCHLREGLRTFALDRVKWLRVQDELRFRYPSDFDLQAHLARGWQLGGEGEIEEVVVRFDPKRAAWISGSQWHPTQKIEHRPDGSILFRVTISGNEEMLYWILSFGGDAEVLSPQTLRDTVAAEARAMAASYGPVTART